MTPIASGSSAISPGLVEVLQFIAWLLALLQFILSLYVLGLNRHSHAHRTASLFLAVLAVNTFALGSLSGAQNAQQAYLPTLLLAITIPSIQAILLLTSLALLKPEIFASRPEGVPQSAGQRMGRGPLSTAGPWLLRLLWLMAILPVALSLFDAWLAPSLGLSEAVQAGVRNGFARFGAPLWFSGPPAGYSGGYLAQASFTQGLLSTYLVILYFAVLGIGNLLVLLYLGFFDRKTTDMARRLAKFLFAADLISAAAGQPFLDAIQPIPFLMGNLLFVLVYTHAIFQVMNAAMFTGRSRPADRLQVRLTWLALAIALPLLAGMGLFLTDQARQELQSHAAQNLAALNQSIYDSTWLWLESQEQMAKSLAGLQAIRSRQTSQQQPPLDTILASLPEAYLAATLDEQGGVIAAGQNPRPGIISSPGSAVAEQSWFREIVAGAAMAYQPLIQRDIWLPDLLLAAPIQDEQGKAAGAVVLASSTAAINRQIQGLPLGDQGIAYLVDGQNRLVAHSTWNRAEGRQNFSLQDLSAYPPVAALRQGMLGGGTGPNSFGRTAGGHFEFVDDSQQRWQAHISQMPNGWGVVVQIPQSQLLAPIQKSQRIAWAVLAIGAALLLGLTWLSISQSMLPVRTLTAAAAAIAAGDIHQPPVLEGSDELGLLGRAFNSMTGQLRQQLTGLEQSVAERTATIARRAAQIEVAAEVAHQASAARQLDELLQNIVQLITERFGHYHTGIFLISAGSGGPGSSPEAAALVPQLDAGEPGAASVSVGTERSRSAYAVLQAASSPGGKDMLARHHRLKVGETGIVGYVAATGQARIALDVGSDAVFFNNPDLPDTRSEMALPLRARRRMIGVLDVQSTQEAAFDQEDVEIMLVLADQLAVAIDNLRLLEESQAAIRELERSYSQQVRQRWKERLAGHAIAFKYDGGSIRPAGADTTFSEAQPGALELPINLRGRNLGRLILQKQPAPALAPAGETPSGAAPVWSQEEVNLARQTLAQLALALENARLLEEIQQSASQEALINQILSKAQSSLELETVLQIIVQEIGYSIGASKVQLRLGSFAQPAAESNPSARGEA